MINLKNLHLIRPLSYLSLVIQLVNGFIGTASILIGINLWFEPQISEHWP